MQYACATCAKTSCFRGDHDGMPKTCPTRTDAAIATDASPYLDDERAAVMRAADNTPFSEDGSKRNRVQELANFAKSRGMHRVGIAFCVTLEVTNGIIASYHVGRPPETLMAHWA